MTKENDTMPEEVVDWGEYASGLFDQNKVLEKKLQEVNIDIAVLQSKLADATKEVKSLKELEKENKKLKGENERNSALMIKAADDLKARSNEVNDLRADLEALRESYEVIKENGNKLSLVNERLTLELDQARSQTAQMLGRQNHEICQTLGEVLGYGTIEGIDEDIICVGDHVAETISLEAANYIKKLESEVMSRSDMVQELSKKLHEVEVKGRFTTPQTNNRVATATIYGGSE